VDSMSEAAVNGQNLRHGWSPETKKPAGGGRAIDDRKLIDQSRHRAAKTGARHQKRAVELAAMAFRCVIFARW
ncbi:MAG: hypothetical protein ACJ8D5_08170, partial [Sphingomicrobium sp.]